MKKLAKKQKLIILISIILIAFIVGIAVSINVIKINIANGKYNTANSNSGSGNLLPEYIKEGITLGGVTGSLVDLDTSDATATEWDITYGKTAYVDGKKITGIFVPRSSLKVGDYVDYTPDTASDYSLPSSVSGYTSNQTISQDTSLKWQILNINNDGTLDLISNKQTDQLISFTGALGYNNCVYILNDICAKQYSNKELGVTARSINLEDDIEPKMNEKGILARNSYGKGETYVYGNIMTYKNKTYTYYPSLYAQEKGSGIDTGTARKDGLENNEGNTPISEKFKQAKTSLTATSNEYAMSGSETPKYFDDSNFYNLIFGINFNYWLASRCVHCSASSAYFYLRRITNNEISDNILAFSGGTENTRENYLRIIIPLKKEVQFYSGDGTEEHPYRLKLK